jgi:small nuclear ribonucleoprotein (snRNP)-like protein
MPEIQIAGLIIIDEIGNNLQYRPSDYMPTRLNTTYFDGINNADASIIYNQTKNINFDIYKHTVVNDMYNNNIINIIHKNDKTLIGTINCADKQNSFTSQDISEIIIDLGSKINISTIILFPYIKKECDYKYAGHQSLALEKVKDSNDLYSCSLGMIGGTIALLDENKNVLFDWRLTNNYDENMMYNSVLLEKDINGNYNPSKNIFFIVESQNKLSFKNIPKIYEKFDINIAPVNNSNSIKPNVNNGNSINPILELSMNTIKPDIDVIPSMNTIKPRISVLPNISEDIIGISNNVTMPKLNMPKLNMPAMPQIPIATPGMITNLLNNGIGIDYLTSQGMALNSAYRGPSTNIIQTNFSGTSNVYSPFLYYNKGSSEKFIDKLYHPYP